MIRAVAIALLLTNVVFFAWHQGHLAVLGFAPARTTEPERVQQQVRPEAIRILSPEEAKRVQAAAKKPPECFISAPIEPSKLEGLRSALPGLMATHPWQIETAEEPERWIAYMGKYANAEAVAKKKAELRGLGVSYETLRNASLEPGVSLGGGSERADAQRKLNDAAAKGVRTGKVQIEVEATTVQRLKLPQVTEAVRAKWPEIKTAGGFAQFVACKSQPQP